MTVHLLEDGRFLVAVKGAPDELLKRVTQIESNGDVQPTKTSRDQILTVNELATQALRVLAFAYKVITTVPTTVNTETLENDLVFAGMVGMIDPERPEVEQAVAEAKSAGIRPLMITGDHRDTAEAIAVRLVSLTLAKMTL